MGNSPEPKPLAKDGFWWLAPALAGVYSPLAVFTKSTGDANLFHFAGCSIAVVVIAIVLAHLLRAVFADATRASLAAVVLLVWVFSYASYVRLGKLFLDRITLSPLRDYF